LRPAFFIKRRASWFAAALCNPHSGVHNEVNRVISGVLSALESAIIPIPGAAPPFSSRFAPQIEHPFPLP
jgi:hypothetical protein